MLEKANQNTHKIEYPCKWIYKVIGEDVDVMIKVIEAVVLGMDYQIASSNISKNGKYYSLGLEVVVSSEINRNQIFQKLTDNESIKYVL